LIQLDTGQDLLVELDDADLLFVSFLDEFVEALQQGGRLARLTFISERPEWLRKLRRLQDSRSENLFLLVDGQRVRVEPEPAPSFVETAADHDPPVF
jgi:hypothetical protein